MVEISKQGWRLIRNQKYSLTITLWFNMFVRGFRFCHQRVYREMELLEEWQTSPEEMYSISYFTSGDDDVRMQMNNNNDQPIHMIDNRYRSLIMKISRASDRVELKDVHKGHLICEFEWAKPKQAQDVIFQECFWVQNSIIRPCITERGDLFFQKAVVPSSPDQKVSEQID